jgi:hypothetical protein
MPADEPSTELITRKDMGASGKMDGMKKRDALIDRQDGALAFAARSRDSVAALPPLARDRAVAGCIRGQRAGRSGLAALTGNA